MSLKFSELMQKYYDDPKLGIKTEDAPANSVSGGGVSLPPDAQMDKKRKKKSMYDGRTKEGKRFVERIMKRRQAREERKAKAEEYISSVTEGMKEFHMSEGADNLQTLRDIVKSRQAKKIKFKDGKTMTVDMFTASAIVQVYDKISNANQKKMLALINGSSNDFLKAQKVALSVIK
jgi:hypothetical protein